MIKNFLLFVFLILSVQIISSKKAYKSKVKTSIVTTNLGAVLKSGNDSKRINLESLKNLVKDAVKNKST